MQRRWKNSKRFWSIEPILHEPQRRMDNSMTESGKNREQQITSLTALEDPLTYNLDRNDDDRQAKILTLSQWIDMKNKTKLKLNWIGKENRSKLGEFLRYCQRCEVTFQLTKSSQFIHHPDRLPALLIPDSRHWASIFTVGFRSCLPRSLIVRP